MAALNEREEFEFRLRAEKEAGGRPVAAAAAAAPPGSPSLIPDTPAQPVPPKNEPSTADSLIQGAPEAALTMGTGAVGSGVANIVAAVREIAARTMGADQQQGRMEGQEAGGKVAEALTYQPRGEGGKKAVKTVGELMKESKLEGLNPAVATGAMVPNAGAKVGELMKRGGKTVGGLMDELGEAQGGARPPAPAMAGVGAAETDAARLRRERAGSLDVPLKLSKGEATRDFEQLRFERETAKSGSAGKPIREHLAENNERILRNFDTWVEQTGAEAPTLRAVGQVVDEALVTKAKKAKETYNKAYADAREAGEMAERMPTQGIVAFIEKNRSAARNAPVIAAVEDELVRLGGATKGADGKLVPGTMAINDLEEVRQMVGKLAEPGTPNSVFGREAKIAIDAATEGATGTLFKRARTLRTQYAKEFEERGVVAKLLDTKGTSADRAVALEDVFSHSILDRSLDDVRHLRRVLQDDGPKGSQAWRELQGQTVNYLREQATKSVAQDTRGNKIVSPSGLDKAVRDLDASGKLDFIFGKQGAQKIRDLNDLAKDITAPPGVVNTSNTGSVVLEGLKEMGKHLITGKLGALLKVGDLIKKGREEGKLKRRVSEALAEAE